MGQSAVASKNENENEKEKEKEKDLEKEQARASLRLALRLHWKKSSSLRSRFLVRTVVVVQHRFGLPPSAFGEEAETMPNGTTFLLHEKLVAWQVAFQLLKLVREARISDANLRDQAMRAAQSACLNISEANGRVTLADRRRVFAIARGEATEAAAALQVAAASGLCAEEFGEAARRVGGRAAALLTGLIG